ncbi:hypothetical protein HPP92_027771, partial [Vanilla planifolia]
GALRIKDILRMLWVSEHSRKIRRYLKVEETDPRPTLMIRRSGEGSRMKKKTLRGYSREIFGIQGLEEIDDALTSVLGVMDFCIKPPCSIKNMKGQRSVPSSEMVPHMLRQSRKVSAINIRS